MKREDEIRNKAYELGQKYFPNANNVWARANIEAQYVSSACAEMAEWMQKKMLDKLRELQSCYENDLDAEPRVYERDIQLCAKMSLIEKLIQELEY